MTFTKRCLKNKVPFSGNVGEANLKTEAVQSLALMELLNLPQSQTISRLTFHEFAVATRCLVQRD